jgi:hypothetical protein
MSNPILPSNLSAQIILNNIAGLVINNSISSSEEPHYIDAVEDLLRLHRSIKRLTGSGAKINVLDGVDFDGCKVIDFYDLQESADEQVDKVQQKAYNDMERLIIQQQKYVRGHLPEKMRLEHEKIISEFKSIGYKTIDKMVSVKSDSQKSLDAIKEIMDADNDVNCFVDVRRHGRVVDIYFPGHLSQNVLHNLNNFNNCCDYEDEHIMIEKLIVTGEQIPGMKDIIDVEKARERKREMGLECSM